jgi:hypothetical protein
MMGVFFLYLILLIDESNINFTDRLQNAIRFSVSSSSSSIQVYSDAEWRSGVVGNGLLVELLLCDLYIFQKVYSWEHISLAVTTIILLKMEQAVKPS